MTDKEALQQYVAVAEFFSKVFADNVEIAIHSLEDLASSTVAIFNNHVSGRDIGAPMTNFGLELLESRQHEHCDFIVNYKGVAKGGTPLRSSTFFIRNEGRLIGFLCVNTDISAYLGMFGELKKLIHVDNGDADAPAPQKQLTETFPKTLQEIVSDTIAGHISATHTQPDAFSVKDKTEITRRLAEQGLFRFKGGIGVAAEALGISEPSIYRYLAKIPKNTLKQETVL